MEELSVSWSTLEVARDPPISCFYSHILLLLLSPTRHIIPLFNTSKPFRILLHVYDILLHAVADRISPFGKYLAPKIWENNEFGSYTNLQPCLRSIAKLKACMLFTFLSAITRNGRVPSNSARNAVLVCLNVYKKIREVV